MTPGLKCLVTGTVLSVLGLILYNLTGEGLACAAMLLGVFLLGVSVVIANWGWIYGRR